MQVVVDHILFVQIGQNTEIKKNIEVIHAPSSVEGLFTGPGIVPWRACCSSLASAISRTDPGLFSR